MKKIIIIFFLFINRSYAEELIVIVNKSNQIENISKTFLKKIYLGKIISWENNTPVSVVDYKMNSQLRGLFSNMMLNMRPRKVYKIWIRNALSGKMPPPNLFNSEQEIIDFVMKFPQAIGYIKSKNLLNKEIKRLSIK